MPAPTEFREGDLVRYVPYHAHGNLGHPDCERGIVSSVWSEYIHVRFGTDQYSKSCRSDQLVLVSRAHPLCVDEARA